ncbi:kinase-like protein, partial [Pyrenochaeta sp. DS3sAY3a]
TMAPSDKNFHPTALVPDIVTITNTSVLTAEEEERLKGVKMNFSGKPVQLCRACHWSTMDELTGSYLPRVHIEYTRRNGGLWSMGNDWMLWDRTDDYCKNDYMTHQFLQKHNTKNIPLVKRMAEFKDESSGHNFVVMSRAKGVQLEEVWYKLSVPEKRSYAQQMAAALKELRQFTAEFPQRVDGSPLWDNVIGHCDSRKECIKIGKTAEEWIGNIEEELREGIARQLKTKDKTLIDTRFKEIKGNFPEQGPYVLTHADLNLSNILVHEGKIVAIIDWERAGYYPWWVEKYMSYQHGLSRSGNQLFGMVWKELDIRIKDMMDVVEPVMSAYKWCPISHTGEEKSYQRPAFCKCKPYGGFIRSAHVDAESKHFIDYDRVTQGTWIPPKAQTDNHTEP